MSINNFDINHRYDNSIISLGAPHKILFLAYAHFLILSIQIMQQLKQQLQVI